MINPKFGDIVIVRFHPSYGQELKKYRPAIIVKDLSSIDPRFIQIAPLTTQANPKPNNHKEIIINHSSLEKPSLLLAWYIMTFDISRLVYKLGELDSKTINKLQNTLT